MLSLFKECCCVTKRSRIFGFIMILIIAFWNTGKSVEQVGPFGNSYLVEDLHIREGSLVIFYNLFISSEGSSNAIDVFHDQMKQISLAIDHHSGAILYYNLIGNGFQPKKVNSFCHQLNPKLSCRLINHYNETDESATLQDLYDFCHSDQVKNSNKLRVTYLHSKGSYHPRWEQHPWRRELTRASLHQDCLYPPDDRCDVCSAQFYTLFAMIFPGNMWTAKCSYIRKLLPPQKGGEYEKLKDESIKLSLLLRAESIFVNNAVKVERVDMYGLGRYMNEHWVTSHPSLIPCEIHSTEVNLVSMLSGNVKQLHDEWAMNARRHWIDPKQCTKSIDNLNDNENFREYFYLAGNMIKWITLYGEIPPQESWVWSHFRGGERWRQLAKQHGVEIVDLISKNSTFGHKRESKILAPRMSSRNFAVEDPPPIVIYYHVSFPVGRDEAYEVVTTQFNLLLSHGKLIQSKIFLNYIIAGGDIPDIEFMLNLCAGEKGNILCRFLGTYDSAGALGNMGELYRFCTAYPSLRVTYITNQPKSYCAEDVQDHIEATSSIISQTGRNVTCNVGGIDFVPQPFTNSVSSMFSASCGYIKKLPSPEIFQKITRDIIGDMLLAYMKHLPPLSTREDYQRVHYHSKLFTSVLSRLTFQTVGQQSALWIQGHPDFKPCGKTQSLSTNATIVRNNVSFAEYFLLGLNVLLWRRAYDNIPRLNNWFWQRFPEVVLFIDADEIVGFLFDSWSHCVNHCMPFWICLDRTKEYTPQIR